MGKKTDLTTPADRRIIISQHCGAASKKEMLSYGKGVELIGVTT